MRTSIVRSISDHDEKNKVVYTLGIEKGNNPSVRLSVTGAVNDDNIYACNG